MNIGDTFLYQHEGREYGVRITAIEQGPTAKATWCDWECERGGTGRSTLAELEALVKEGAWQPWTGPMLSGSATEPQPAPAAPAQPPLAHAPWLQRKTPSSPPRQS